MKWSSFQMAIFDEYRDGTGNVCVSAVPGSGKSTSAVEMLKHAPKGLRGNTLLTSFSKDSVEELKARDLPWDVEARTMNSLGLRAVIKGRNGVNPKLNTERVYRILDEVFGKPPEDQAKRAGFGSFRARVKALTDFAKNNLVYDIVKLLELADHYEIETTPPDWMRDALADKFGCPWEDSIAVATQRTLDACKKDDGSIDFNDQLWLPVVLGYPVEQFSRIVCDELQDTNHCQVELLRKALSPNGRLFGFGETLQAVYTFRGAGIGLEPIIKSFNMKQMPLSISYRCPIAVVKEAQQINPEMQWAPDTIQGSVSTLVPDLLPTRLLIGDTVLSRTNAPLIRLFMKCLSNGIPVGMAGKDVGARLLKFVENSSSIDTTQLLEYTDQWAKDEIERRKKRNPNAKTDAIDDHVECIRALAEDTNSIVVVVDRIKKMLLVPPAARVTLSTVHRFKGRESDRCYLLDFTFPVRAAYWRQYASTKKGDPDKWSAEVAQKIQQESIEERNIMYVAITRAKRELIYVR
jgi:DNA helicase-2/ATP-dependent DNA helicase PcrA